MDEDRILEEIKKDPAVEVRLHEVLQLQDIVEHPGWKYMTERLTGFRKKAAGRLAERLMKGVDVPPAEIHFQRGYAQGVEDVLRYPDRLEREYERAAEQAFRRAEAELSTQEVDET